MLSCTGPSNSEMMLADLQRKQEERQQQRPAPPTPTPQPPPAMQESAAQPDPPAPQQQPQPPPTTEPVGPGAGSAAAVDQPQQQLQQQPPPATGSVAPAAAPASQTAVTHEPVFKESGSVDGRHAHAATGVTDSIAGDISDARRLSRCLCPGFECRADDMGRCLTRKEQNYKVFWQRYVEFGHWDRTARGGETAEPPAPGHLGGATQPAGSRPRPTSTAPAIDCSPVTAQPAPVASQPAVEPASSASPSPAATPAGDASATPATCATTEPVAPVTSSGSGGARRKSPIAVKQEPGVETGRSRRSPCFGSPTRAPRVIDLSSDEDAQTPTPAAEETPSEEFSFQAPTPRRRLEPKQDPDPQ